ncbi:hypothetical protein PCANC_10737 [Puccinia coronata f. sp. avenae]|uniref:Uncharacterized protein n=1 Tax=Puccinia coronata f. sp. avenae TaxID=200324 RepID=A0A2N5VST2_9BASI|nr:hypothetical protein PCANC_10737 [Puccinia coronata f. sp. avenae]
MSLTINASPPPANQQVGRASFSHNPFCPLRSASANSLRHPFQVSVPQAPTFPPTVPILPPPSSASAASSSSGPPSSVSTNHSSHDSCQATPNQASCSNNNNMSLQTPFSASPIYPQSLFHHSPGSVSSATSPARVRTPPWKMIPTTIKLFPNHPRQAGQYLSHISTNLGQTPVTSQPRHCANGNTNFTNHSHDGSSEQSHQSPHLVSQHPLSKSRLPLAYPPTNSPTFPSNSSPAYDSVMNSRTARPNSTFRSSAGDSASINLIQQALGKMIVCCPVDQHRPMAIDRSMYLPHSACDPDECRCSPFTCRSTLAVIPHPNFISLQHLDLQLGPHAQTLVWLHPSALPAGIPPLFTSLPMTCVGRLRVSARLPSIPYDFANTPSAEAFSSTIRKLQTDLVDIKPFWETLRPQSEMLKMVSPTTSGHSHARTAAGILGVFNNIKESETVTFLGALQPVVSWKHILIKAYAPTPWSDGSTPASRFASAAVPIPTSSSGAVSIPVLPASVDQTQIRSVATIRTNALSTSEAVSMTTTARPNSTAGKTSQPAAASPASESSMDNVKALRSIASSIYQSLNPFFSAIIKLFSSRRVTDEALKKQALYTASLLAQVLSGNLVWPDADNPSSNFVYLTVFLNTASQLLTDERGNRTTLNSLILSPFFDSGGL